MEDILKIPNLPYRDDIARGIEAHRESFKWYTSLSNGNYCKSFTNETIKNYKHYYRQYNTNNNESIEESRKRIILLSYPRSGNHLTRAILECLLNISTYGYQREHYSVYIERTIGAHTAKQTAQRKRPYIRKYHSVNHIKEMKHPFGLILLVRDPLESITSECKTRPYFWKDYEHQMEEYLDLNALISKHPQCMIYTLSHIKKVIHFIHEYMSDAQGIDIKIIQICPQILGINLDKLKTVIAWLNAVDLFKLSHILEQCPDLLSCNDAERMDESYKCLINDYGVSKSMIRNNLWLLLLRKNTIERRIKVMQEYDTSLKSDNVELLKQDHNHIHRYFKQKNRVQT